LIGSVFSFNLAQRFNWPVREGKNRFANDMMIISETFAVSSAFEKFATAENICPATRKMKPSEKSNTNCQ
jgi:hypothetical protein